MLGIVNSSSLMRILPDPAVVEVPPLLSGLGCPHRHDHPVVGPSTIMVSAPTAVALSRMPAASAVAHILHSCVDVPNFVLIVWLLLIIYVLLCITCVFGAS